MKTISLPTHNRPVLLQRCLASIASAVGSSDWTVVFSCEPHSVTSHIATAWRSSPSYFHQHSVRLGCWHNTFHAATLAMALAPTVNLYLEDDYLLSPDALTLVDQWAESGRDGVLVLRRPHESQDLAHAEGVSPLASGLFGCGFAWRGPSWPLIRAAWFSQARTGPGCMWDISMAAHLASTPQWRPLVNRSHGIGTTGTHSRSGADLNLFGPAYSGPPITQFTFA